MKSSTEEIVQEMGLLYRNIYSLLTGFQLATKSNLDSIIIKLEKEDGTFEEVSVNSFQKLQNELSRLDNNFKALTNIDNLSYILDATGQISQIHKTSFMNAEYLSKFNISENCVVDKTSIINNLIFPNVKIPITIDSTLKTGILARMFDVTSGFEDIKEDSTILDIKYLIQNGSVIAEESQLKLELQKEEVKYHGLFGIVSIDSVKSNIYSITITDTKYSSINSIGKNIDLKVGDFLVSKSGASKYKITYIDLFSKTVRLQRVSGSEILSVGLDNLLYNEIIKSDNNIVGIPIQPKKDLAIFLSIENDNAIGFPSKVIKISTSNYKVNYNNQTYTLDEFFSTYVTNISEYLIALVKESNIPLSLGIQPKVPKLDSANFKVIQINKHLNNTKSDAEIKTLNESKQKIKNDIEYKQNEINSIQQEIDTMKYRSTKEKDFRLERIITLRNDVSILNQNLLTVSRDIDNNAVQYGLKTLKPKYRCIGFWELQEPIYSPLTKEQYIIKYEIQYRYLSKNVDTIDTTSVKMINNGKEINIAFSSWNDLPTKTLNKISDVSGKLIWETPVLDSVDSININQCMISINEGESLEIRVRSVSEAGYPLAPLKSEWSEILRVEFPMDMTETNITTLVASNEDDLLKAELQLILQNAGLIQHISGTIKESEKTFFHSTKDIASGFYTAEQKNIPLNVYLQTLTAELDKMKNSSVVDNLFIELIDFNNEKYIIKNNTTMEINAGNYGDTINLFDETAFGSIIRKQAYIKIRNKNIIPIELKSMVPGNIFNETTAGKYYNVPVKYGDTGLSQSSKQIIYFRNLDITGQNEDIFKIVLPGKPINERTDTFAPANFIDSNAVEGKNLIQMSKNKAITEIKLVDKKPEKFLNFSIMTNENPLYIAYSQATSDESRKNALIREFMRLRNMTNSLKADSYQTEYSFYSSDENGTGNHYFGFDDNDKFAVGTYTCGAFLYPVISNPNKICVVGNTSVSTLVIPADSEIIIPIVFEYRMTDRLGYYDGNTENTINDDIKYSKKLGIDILINNEEFKFDINCYSKLKSKVQSVSSVNVSTIAGAFNNEDKEQLT